MFIHHPRCLVIAVHRTFRVHLNTQVVVAMRFLDGFALKGNLKETVRKKKPTGRTKVVGTPVNLAKMIDAMFRSPGRSKKRCNSNSEF